ncbi:hypothetical protein PE067_20540 [Paracoccus sp. DMF-8]|uniref:hypothetical protein n=1 Tax=Paracoccus sp. DMF-8 TaxID=3019445 RepID=UPI0023E3FC40|nr:hypothetical protein [Paracoccus sp. DMF-8]MDF3608320.1 hypothetical protein [Paracoccus sp. DMF-8]
MSNCIRALAMDAVEAANSGHPEDPMGMAALWTRHQKADAAAPDWPAPDWPDRDWPDREILNQGWAGRFGWTRHVASGADVAGLRGFGAPAPVLYEKFGITAAAIVVRAKTLLT